MGENAVDDCAAATAPLPMATENGFRQGVFGWPEVSLASVTLRIPGYATTGAPGTTVDRCSSRDEPGNWSKEIWTRQDAWRDPGRRSAYRAKKDTCRRMCWRRRSVSQITNRLSLNFPGEIKSRGLRKSSAEKAPDPRNQGGRTSGDDGKMRERLPGRAPEGSREIEPPVAGTYDE